MDPEIEERLKAILPPMDVQKQIASFVDGINYIEKACRIVKHAPQDDIYKRFEEGYRTPTPEELRDHFEGRPQREIAKIIGAKDSRTIRKWIAGDRQIPYSSWRLFLIATGIVLP